jgi:hypothetical protein
MASKRGLRRRQCGNKNKLIKEAAIRVASEMGHRRPGQSYDAYPCGSCGSWHVGHRPNFIRHEINKRRAA